MSKPWSPQAKRLIAAGVIISGALVFYRVRSVLAPLALAMLLAYILNPLVGLLRKAKISRTGATIIVYLLLIFALVAFPSILVPPLVQQLISINVDFAAILDHLRQLIVGYRTVEFLGFSIDLYRVFADIRGELATFVGSLASQSVAILLGAASSALWLIFILIISFYLLKDAERITSYLGGLAPPGYQEELSQLVKAIGQIWDSFLLGQIILSSAVGGITAATMWVVGVKNALLLGILAGILEIIPNLGPALAALPAVALAFFLGSEHLALSNGWFALLVAGLYVAIQQVENNFLVPRIIGRSVNLHPVVVIVGTIVGAMVGGILGIFLAAPVLGSARILGGYLYRKFLQSEEALAQPPLPQQEVPLEEKRESEKASE
ncbi:MAG: AI-2E family transporter [Anaerolineae bacterium]|nr:AI-2E family transporter [Anaerolineae bacterium]